MLFNAKLSISTIVSIVEDMFDCVTYIQIIFFIRTLGYTLF